VQEGHQEDTPGLASEASHLLGQAGGHEAVQATGEAAVQGAAGQAAQGTQGIGEEAAHVVSQEVSQVVGREASQYVGQEAGQAIGQEVGKIAGQEAGQMLGEQAGHAAGQQAAQGATQEASQALGQTASGEGALPSMLKPEDRPQASAATEQIEPGMDVTDADGHKVGSVNHVYHQAAAAVASGGGDSGLPHEDIFEVKTGFLGLGKHFYVPSSAVQDVSSGTVRLSQPRARFDQQGWETRPNIG